MGPEASHPTQQVIAELAEKAAVIVTSNLPFSEWNSGDSECPAVQGTDRPHYRSGAH